MDKTLTSTVALKKLPSFIEQPGPLGEPYDFATSRLVELDVELPENVSIQDGLTQAIKSLGLAGGYVRIAKAKTSKLEYVIPALSPDGRHAAWYSRTHKPAMPGSIKDVGIICGTLSGEPFFHCHGLYEDVHNNAFMGHLLPHDTILSAPVSAIGFGFKDASFTRGYDAQTNFDLFTPKQLSPAPNSPDAALLRITPNIEISAPLIEHCQNVCWSRASVHGVGSLIGAKFADGRTMNSFATEVLITNGMVDLTGNTPRVDLEIALVGLDGKFMHGLLAPSGNPVLITFELIVKKQSEDK